MKRNAVSITLFVIILFVAFLCLILSVNIPIASASQEEVRFEVNAPDMTEKEYEEYYKQNDILPANPEGSGVYLENENDVIGYLSNNQSGYTWSLDLYNSASLSDKYGADPINIKEDEYQYIIDAKADSSNIHDAAGCGALALISQFNYLAETLGYSAFNYYSDDNFRHAMIDKNRYLRAKEVLTTTIGADGPKGRFIAPSNLISSANKILKSHGLQDIIRVYGDTVSHSGDLKQKITTLKTAIDNGIGVLWWTGTGFGNYKDHYMNIFGYETYKGVDAVGNAIEHVFFKINMNWGNITTVCLDSNVLSSSLMGFIYVQPIKPQLWVRPYEVGTGFSYNSTVAEYNQMSSSLYKMVQVPMSVRYLRSAYVRHYNSTNTLVDAMYLSMSPRKQGAGVAYIEFSFPKAVSELHFDVSWWRNADMIPSSMGEAKLQYRNAAGEWVTKIDFLETSQTVSTDLTVPSKFKVTFDEIVPIFRFYTSFNNPTNSRNGGRFILHDMNVFFLNP